MSSTPPPVVPPPLVPPHLASKPQRSGWIVALVLMAILAVSGRLLSKTTPPPANSPSASATSAPKGQERPSTAQAEPSLEYTFPVQGGAEIHATVYPAPESAKRVVLYDPWIEGTDGNTYLAVFHAFYFIYPGKHRGLITLQEAQVVDEPNGKALCWKVANPGQDFCAMTVWGDSANVKIAGMVVWVQ